MNRLVVATMLGSALITTPAVAQSFGSGMGMLCRMIPCVYDAQNTLVGIPQAEGFVMRRIGATWYQVEFTKDGPTPDATFLFKSADCTGQPYFLGWDFIPMIAEYDGQSFWTGAGAEETITWQSYASPSLPKNGGQCRPNDCGSHGNVCGPEAHQPIVKIQTQAFNPPFRMQ